MEEKEKILQSLMHHPGTTFNRLWNKEGRSNKFAYHLKSLEEEGLVKKTALGYELTHKGKEQAAYLTGKTGKVEKMPLLAVAIVVVKGNKILLQKRTKEPFYGYWAFPSGKVRFEQYLTEAAQAELKEETGLSCDLELKGLFSSKTYNNKELSYNHQIFIFKGINPTGQLTTKDREGENKWFTKTEIKKLKTFPNIPHFVKIVSGQNFSWLEADRFQEDDVFKGMEILKNKKI